MSGWDMNKIAKAHMIDLNAEIGNDKKQYNANINKNKQMKNKLFKSRNSVNKNGTMEKIAKIQSEDLEIQDQINRMLVNNKLTPEQLAQKNNTFLTPQDASMIEYYKQKTQNVNPNLANITQPILQTPPEQDGEWFAIDPNLSKGGNEKILIETEKKFKQGSIVSNNIKQKLKNAKTQREETLLKTNLSKIEDTLRNLNVILRIVKDKNNEVDDARALWVSKNIDSANKDAVDKYNEEVSKLSSGMLSQQQMPNETEEDYIKRINTQLEATIMGDQKEDAYAFINRQFISAMSSLGIDLGIIEQLNSELRTEAKEQILKMQGLFKKELMKLAPLWRLNLDDLIGFIEEFLRKNNLLGQAQKSVRAYKYQPSYQAPEPLDMEEEYVPSALFANKMASEFIPDESDDVRLTMPNDELYDELERKTMKELIPMARSLNIRHAQTTRKAELIQEIVRVKSNPDLQLTTIPSRGRPKRNVTRAIKSADELDKEYEDYARSIEQRRNPIANVTLGKEDDYETFLNKQVDNMNFGDDDAFDYNQFPPPPENIVPKTKKSNIKLSIKKPKLSLTQPMRAETKQQKFGGTEKTKKQFLPKKLKIVGSGLSVEHLQKQLYILKGEIMAGNDNLHVLEQVKNVLMQLYKKRIISKSQMTMEFNMLKNYNR